MASESKAASVTPDADNKVSLSPAAQKAIVGAIVADAAALGLHWMYDQPTAVELGGTTPEFFRLDASLYEGKMAYFAHGKKKVGDLSMYGERTLLAAGNLIKKGKLDRILYERDLAAYFGAGGDYVGYVDHAHHDMLWNIESAKRRAATAMDSDTQFADQKDIHTAAKKAVMTAANTNTTKAELIAAVTAATEDNDAVRVGALRLAETYSDIALAPKGCSDDQNPAIARIPAIVAAAEALSVPAGDFDAFVLNAISFTHANDEANVYGLFAARLLRDAIAGKDLLAAIAEHSTAAALGDSPVGQKAFATLQEVQKTPLTTSYADEQKRVGLPCWLRSSVPGVVFLLRSILADTSSSATDQWISAVRQNITAGGDSCGRAILVGSILGTRTAIPWTDRVTSQFTERLARLGISGQ